MAESVVIVSAMRTPIGSFQGSLSSIPGPKLGSIAIKAALEKSGIDPQKVDECTMGEVLTAGVGQAPARQAALFAGLSESVPCMTINKVCGSGLKAVMLACDSIALGRAKVAVAGGQENMSLTPHLLPQSREGLRMGNATLIDSMVNDGLWDPYNNFHMGVAAELCAKEKTISREAQDAFAIESYRRAQSAQSSGLFANELAPVEVSSRKATTVVDIDEEPGRAKFDKIPTLRPAFDKSGTITAANASKINDGAAALVLTSESQASSLGVQPLARIVAEGVWAQDPKWFTTAPGEAMKLALSKAKLTADEIDLWEINEAFSVVALTAIKDLDLDGEKVNVHGGAVALGHPIGASGARILTTLVHALHSQKKRYGMSSLCIGGGEAVALIVERL